MALTAYVAAPLALWQKARLEIDTMRQLGLSIAHDWTQGAEAFFKADGRAPIETNEEIATSCIEAVKASDFVFALLEPMVPTQGVWCEIGAALALEKPVFGYLPAINVGLAEVASSQADILRAELELQRAREWQRRAAFLGHPLCFVSGSYVTLYKQIELLVKGRHSEHH